MARRSIFLAMKHIRLTAWALVVVVLTIMAGYIATRQVSQQSHQRPTIITPVAGFNQAAHFTLTDHRNDRFDSAEKIQDGDLALVFFGFTHCPVICPTELQKMAVALDMMPQHVQDRLHPLFITIDPERDTVDLLGTYVPQFHPDIIGLTGDTETIHAVLDDWKVFYKKVNDPAFTEYTMDHSTYAYLVDHNMTIVALFSMKATEDDIAQKIIQIIRLRA